MTNELEIPNGVGIPSGIELMGGGKFVSVGNVLKISAQSGHAVKTIVATFIAVSMTSCFGSRPSGNEGFGAFKVRPSRQLVTSAPSSPFEPVTFRIVDEKEEALPGVKVSFCLIRLPEHSVSAEILTLYDLCRTGATAMDGVTIPSGAAPPEYLGLITGEQQKFTDMDGEVTLYGVSPAEFSASVALVAYYEDGDGIFGASAGYSILTTVSAESQALAMVVSSSNNNQEIAGRSFRINIQMTRPDDRTRTPYSGQKLLRFNSDLPTGGSGFPSKLPGIGNAEDVLCEFINGICSISDQMIATAGTAVVTVSDPDGTFVSGTAHITVTVGEPSAITIASQPLSSGFRPICEFGTNLAAGNAAPCMFTVSADPDYVEVYAITVDQGGNPIRDARVSVTVTGSLMHDVTVGDSGTKIVIVPNVVGSGTVLVQDLDSEFSREIQYSIVPGRPSEYVVSTQHNLNELATRPFSTKLTAYDRKGNLCTNFNGFVTANIEMQGATNSPNNVAPVTQFSESIHMVSGVGLSQLKLQATNALETPTVVASLSAGTFTSQPIVISPGPSATLKFRTAASNGGVELTNMIEMDSNATLTLFVAGYDTAGNFTGDAISQFSSAEAAISNSILIPTGASVVIKSNGATGQGYLVATPVGGSAAPHTSPLIRIVSGLAVAFDILTTNNSNEVADQEFYVTIRAKDSQGFVASTYEGTRNLNFVNIANPSWGGVSPVMPTGTIPCAFVEGVCQLPSPYKLTDSRQAGILSVTEPGGTVEGVWSTAINVSSAAAAKLVIADKIGGPAAGALAYTATTVLTADDSLSLAAAITDVAGNFLANAPSSATWSGTSSPAGVFATAFFSPSTGSVTTFTPNNPVGTGTIRVSAPGYSDGVSPSITVNHGVLDHVRVEKQEPGFASVTNIVDPGTCFAFTVSFHDAKHNLITSMSMVNDVTFRLLNAASGPMVAELPKFAQQATGGYSYNVDTVYGGGPPGYAPPTMTTPMGIFGGQMLSLHTHKICLYDASDVSPTLEVSMPAKSGFPAITSIGHVAHTPSDTFSISLGPLHHIHYAATEANSGNFHGSRTFDLNTSAPVGGTQFSVDNGPRTLWAHKHDYACNHLGTASGNWNTTNGNVLSELTGGSNSVSVTLGNTKSAPNGANITFTPTDGTPITATQNFQIHPGVPTSFLARTSNLTNIVTADTSFALDIRLFDQFNNLTWHPVDHDVTYSFVNAVPNSPLGTAPALAVSGSSRFTNGIHLTPTDFRAPNATVNPVIRVAVAGMGQQDLTVSVLPGTPKYSRIKASTGLADPVVTTLSGIAGNSITLYGCGLDHELNSTACDLAGTWSRSGVIQTDNLEPLTGPQTQLSFRSEGVGTVTFTPTNVTIPPYTTGDITIGHGELTGFSVQVGSTNSNFRWQVPAGVAQPITVRARDTAGNTVSTFTGTYHLDWTSVGITNNPEGHSAILPPNGNYTFENGLMTTVVEGTFYNSADALPRITVSYVESGGNVRTGHANIRVNAGAAHHYGFNPSTQNVYPKANHSTTFSATLTIRDQWGNVLTNGGGDSNVMVSMRRANGTAAAGTLVGANLGPYDLSSTGSVSVTGLAYDIGGDHKLWAVGTNFTTTTVGSRTISFNAGPETVAYYTLTVPSSVNAGTAYSWTVRARDNSGGTVTGADSALSGLTFVWQGPGNAPLGEVPALPSTLSFAGGFAYPAVTLYKAESLPSGSISVTDNQQALNGSFNRTGASTSPLVATYSPTIHYTISANATTATADANGRFNVSISTTDPYGNPRPGEVGLNLVPVRVSGVALVGSLQGATVSGISVAPGTLNINNLFYRVPHRIAFNLTGGMGTVVQSSEVDLTPTIHTVSNYQLTIASPVTAGANNITATVSARDGGGNVISNATVDTALSSQTYAWAGASASPSPAAVAPTYQTSLSFTNGVATATHSFRRAQTIAANGITVTDNYSGVSGGARSGASAGAVTVNPATAVSYQVAAPNGTSVTAGAGFPIRVTALDPFSNIDTNWSSDNLTFSWSGTTATPATPNSAGGITPTVHDVAGNESFSAGIFQSAANAFTLYNKTDASPVLQVTGSSIAGPYSLSGWSIASSSTVDYVKVRASNLSTSAEVTTHTMTADNTYTVHSHSYDAWGNHIGLHSVTWSGSGEVSGRLSPTTGTSTTLTPISVGSGVITATPSTGTADDTGVITINPGTITKLVFTGMPVTQTADDCAQVTVKTQDAKNNDSPVNSDRTVTLGATGSAKFFSNNTCTTQVTTRTITNGQSATPIFYFANRVAESSTQTASVASSGWTNASGSATVSHGALTNVHITSAALNHVAGTCGAVSYVVRDQWNNVGTITAARTFNLSSSAGSSEFHSNATCTNSITTQELSTGSGTTFYLKDTAAGLPTLTVASTGLTSATQAQTVRPGTFSITGPSTPHNSNTPEITWGASAGAPSYTVLIDNNSGCGSPERSFSNVSNTSQVVTPALADGTWYVCVTANGNGAPNQAAANTNLARVFDVTSPTSSVSFSGDKGPHSTAGATTIISGTASDATSGLSSVTISLSNGSNCLNGTSAAATFSAACPHFLTATGTTSWSLTVDDTPFVDGTTYTISSKALDLAGNEQSSLGSSTFVWDANPPVATISGQPSAFSNATTLNVDVSGTGVVAYRFKVGAGADCTSSTGYSGTEALESVNITNSVSAIADGSITLCVVARDAALNWQPFASATPYTWTKDTANPTVSAGTNKTVNAAVSQVATASDATALTYAWTKQSGSGTVTFDPSAAVLSPTISASAEDTYSLRLTVTDAAGNSAFSTMTLVWDTTPPTATLSGTPANPSNITALNVDVAGTQVVAYRFKLGLSTIDCSDATGYSGSEILESTNITTSLSAGTYPSGSEMKLCVIGRDAATNWQTFANATAFTWTRDINPPVVDAGADVLAKEIFTQNATVSDASALTYQWTRQSGPGTITFGTPTAEDTTVMASADGTYVIRLTVTDAAGNTAFDEFTLTWDTTPPTATVSGTPTDPSNAAALDVTVGGSGVVVYRYKLAAGTSTICSTEAGYTAVGSAANVSTKITDSLGVDGQYTLCVIGRDAAGNWQTLAQATSYTWTKDTDPPTATLSGGPANPSNATTLDVTVGGAGVTLYRYKLVQGVASVCSDETGYTVVGSAVGVATKITNAIGADAEYTLCVIGRDAAGNWQDLSQATSHTWTKDTIPPTATVSGQPADPSRDITLNIAVSGSGVTHFRKKVGAGAGFDCAASAGYGSETSQSTNITDNISALADGVIKVCVVGRDAAGNWQTFATATEVSWTKDTTPPSAFTISGPGAIVYTATPTISWQNNGDVDSYRLIIDNEATCTSPFVEEQSGISGLDGDAVVQASLADGKYYACLYAMDALGNERSSSSNAYEFEVEKSTVHISYTSLAAGDYYIYHSSWSAGDWTHSDLTNGGVNEEISSRSSLVLDSLERPHLVYGQRSGGLYSLKYAHKTAGWATETIDGLLGGDGDDEWGMTAEIALNNDDHAALLYRFVDDRPSNPDTVDILRSTMGSSGSWTPSTVQTLSGEGDLRDLAVAYDGDSTNVAHVAFIKNDGGVYALRYRNNDGGWGLGVQETPNNLPASCQEFLNVSVFVDSAHRPHLAYTCRTAAGACQIHHAVRTGTDSWTHEQVGTAKSASCTMDPYPEPLRVSIAVDSQDKAHISYLNQDTNAIRYVNNKSGSWTNVSVSGAVTSEGWPTLSLDVDGKVYIFFMGPSGSVQMSTNNSGAWVVSEIVSTGALGIGTAAINGVKGRSSR